MFYAATGVVPSVLSYSQTQWRLLEHLRRGRVGGWVWVVGRLHHRPTGCPHMSVCEAPNASLQSSKAGVYQDVILVKTSNSPYSRTLSPLTQPHHPEVHLLPSAIAGGVETTWAHTKLPVVREHTGYQQQVTPAAPANRSAVCQTQLASQSVSRSAGRSVGRSVSQVPARKVPWHKVRPASVAAADTRHAGISQQHINCSRHLN
jgi:hypothetical protein